MFGAIITNCIISTVVLSCICVFVYLCIYVFVYLCIYVFVYLCICVFVFLIADKDNGKELEQVGANRSAQDWKAAKPQSA